MIISKIHQRSNELVLAACDADLIGKELKHDNGAVINIKESFYKGEETSPERLIELIKQATIINLFGEETINAAKTYCTRIINIQGVPHAQIMKML